MMLRVDLNIVWTIVNILILFALVKIFLFKPIHKIIDARQEEIDKQYADAKKAEEEANEMKKQYDASFGNIETEKATILSAARDQANDEYEKIIAEANVQADKIKSDAKKAAELSQEKYMQQAKEQIADLVVAATAKLVANHQGEEADKELYNEFIKKTGEK